MKKKEMKRLEELEEKAKELFLENTDTKYIIDMLDDNEQKEHKILLEKFILYMKQK